MQISVGPIAVPCKKEVTTCTYFKLGIDHDLAVNRVKIGRARRQPPSAYHRSTDLTRTFPTASRLRNMAVNLDEWELVLASQSAPQLEVPRGVAFYFRAHEQLLAQSYFVDNGSSQPTERVGALQSLRHPERKVVSYVASFFGQDRDVLVPPHSTTSATTRCVFPKPVNLIGMTGHYHFRGVHFTASIWDGTNTGEQVYEQVGYLEPLFKRYGEGELSNVPGIEWTCTWDNPTDDTFKFGPFTDQNEHCNLFAFYYPSIGKTEAMTCVQENREVTVTVRH